MAANDDLITLINKAVEEKTFTMEGLKAISDIKDKAEKLQSRVAILDDQLEQSRKSNADLKSVITARDTEIAVLKGRESVVEAREKKMFDLEKDQAVSFAVKAAYESMFTKMFANRQFRESVQENSNRTVPASGASQYPTQHNENANRTTTTEEL